MSSWSSRKRDIALASFVTGVVVFLLLAYFLPGKSSNASKLSHGGTQAVRLVTVPSGTVTVAITSPPHGFNPDNVAGADSSTAMIMRLVWPQVFWMEPNLQPSLDSSLVTSAYVMSLNPQTIVYHLNPRATWSNGTPINADDFIYDWKVHLPGAMQANGHPYSVPSTTGYEDIKSVVGSDNGSVVTVVFRHPFADWKSLFNSLPPAQLLDKVGWNSGFNRFSKDAMVSGGPFEISAYLPGKEVVLSRNPRYFGPKPSLAHLIFKIIPKRSQEVADLGQHLVDVIFPHPNFSLMEEVGSLGGVISQSDLSMRYEQLDFNLSNPILANLNVRKAIAYATNRTVMMEDTVDQLYPSSRLLGNHLFMNIQPGYVNNGAEYDKPHIRTARKLLAEAGYLPLGGPYLSSGTKALKLTLTADAASMQSRVVEHLFVRQMAKVGIDVTISNAPSSSALFQRLVSGNYDIALVGLRASPYVAYNTLQYSSILSAGGVPQDVTGFESTYADSLILEASEELSPSKAFSLYNRVDQYLWAQMVSLPLFEEPSLLAYNHYDVGITDNVTKAGPVFDAYSWSVVRPQETRTQP